MICVSWKNSIIVHASVQSVVTFTLGVYQFILKSEFTMKFPSSN